TPCNPSNHKYKCKYTTGSQKLYKQWKTNKTSKNSQKHINHNYTPHSWPGRIPARPPSKAAYTSRRTKPIHAPTAKIATGIRNNGVESNVPAIDVKLPTTHSNAVVRVVNILFTTFQKS